MKPAPQPNYYSYFNHPPFKNYEDHTPSRTKQEFVEESDINTIMAKYEPQELALMAGGKEPIYGDFSDPDITDYAAALRQVMGIQDLVQRLPAKVRERFQNDPQAILTWVQNPANREEARTLGMLKPEPPTPTQAVVTPTPPPVVTPTPAPQTGPVPPK